MEIASMETAAWVQAIGTIIALFVATMTPYISGRIDRQRGLTAARELAGQLVSRLRFLVEVADQTSNPAITHVETDLDLTGLGTMFRQFPVERLGGPAIVAFLRLAGICSHARRVWRGDDVVLLGRTSEDAINPRKSADQIRKLKEALVQAETAQLALLTKSVWLFKRSPTLIPAATAYRETSHTPS